MDGGHRPVDTSNTTLCAEHQADGWMEALCILSLFASVLSIGVHAFSMLLLYRAQSFNADIRVMLQNLAVSQCTVGLAGVVRSSYLAYLWRSRFRVPPTSVFLCQAAEIPFNFASTSNSISFVSLALERLLNVVKNRFVDTARPARATYVILAVMWTLTLCGVLLPFAVMSQEEMGDLCFCHSLLTYPLPLLFLLAACLFAVELLTVALFLVLQKRCSERLAHIEDVRYSLTERHQMRTNITASRLIFPPLLTHNAVQLLGLACSLTLRIHTQSVSFVTLVDCLTLLSLLQLFETIVCPLLIICRHETLRRMAVEQLTVLSRLFRPTNVQQLTGPQSLVALAGKANMPSVRVCADKRKDLVEFRVMPQRSADIIDSFWARQARSYRFNVRSATEDADRRARSLPQLVT